MQGELLELVSRCKQGDLGAFENLVGRYQKMVYNLGFRVFGSAPDAEDILQETFMQVHKGLPQFEGSKGLSSWIYTIALNQCRMRLRKQKRAVRVNLDEDAVLHTVVPDVLTLVLDKELCNRMASSIQDLPEPYRLVFILRELEGRSTEETAGLLDLSPTAVKTRLHRARLFLREQLCEYFEH